MSLNKAQLLTLSPADNILFALSAHLKGGIETPFKLGYQKPLLHAVFFCPSKIKAALIRLFSMAGCIGQARAWPSPSTVVSNLIQSATQRLRPLFGGLHPKLGVTAMNTSTDEIRLQNPQNQTINPLLVKAIFELESIETLSLQANKPNLSNPALTLSTIFAHSQRGLNALHDLKNLLGIVPPAEKQGGAL